MTFSICPFGSFLQSFTPLNVTDGKATEKTTPEAETLKAKRLLSPLRTMDKGKRRVSKEPKAFGKESKALASEATVALQKLKDNEYWIESTKIHAPEEWLKVTNKLLAEMEILSLQELLLSLPLPK
jgi:hypothetical protein